MKSFAVLTIFPEMFDGFWLSGMVHQALQAAKIQGWAVNLRDYTHDRHKTTDDRPYGGGCGMVMKPEPLGAALEDVKTKLPGAKVIMLTPQGRVFNQQLAQELADASHDYIFVCGRYEGVDQRLCDAYADFEISTGDYVLTGGELPAMLIIDAVTRLLPGVLGGAESAAKESFASGLLEHAHFTRPPEFAGAAVPEILTSGHHLNIENWRFQSSLMRTFFKRPDLLLERPLTPDELKILQKWGNQIDAIIRNQSVFGAGTLPRDK